MRYNIVDFRFGSSFLLIILVILVFLTLFLKQTLKKSFQKRAITTSLSKKSRTPTRQINMIMLFSAAF